MPAFSECATPCRPRTCSRPPDRVLNEGPVRITRLAIAVSLLGSPWRRVHEDRQSGSCRRAGRPGYSETEIKQTRATSSWPACSRRFGPACTPMPRSSAMWTSASRPRPMAHRQPPQNGTGPALNVGPTAVGALDALAAADKHGCVGPAVVAMLKDAGFPPA